MTSTLNAVNDTGTGTGRRPRLCFVGHMVGRNPGYITTQGMIMADMFEAEGYSVMSVSSETSRYRQMADVISTVIRKRHSYDIMVLDVYGRLSFVLEDVASLLGKLTGKRVVMCLRGGAMPEFSARHPVWTRRVLGRADAIMAPSPFLARDLRPYCRGARVIPNVINISAYPYRHRREIGPRLFWMRSFHDIYNPELAVRVLARLRRTEPGATLVMGGPDKGILPRVQQLARELGVEDAVRFAGFLDKEAKAREGDAADIYLNTNRIDNMPVSVVEACAMGLLVVATAVGGVPDLLTDGENALLVPDDDEGAMTEAVLRLLHEPDLTGRLSENGRRLAECSSWEEVLPQWEELFSEVLSRRDRIVMEKR
jgi:L-malate glycosyltransferase